MDSPTKTGGTVRPDPFNLNPNSYPLNPDDGGTAPTDPSS